MLVYDIKMDIGIKQKVVETRLTVKKSKIKLINTFEQNYDEKIIKR